MTLHLRLHPLAEEELIETWAWYEGQRSGLGDQFLHAARTAVALVVERPGIGTPDRGSAQEAQRRVGIERFPYLVRYQVIDDTLVVLTVYHERRHPDFAADRVPET